MFKIYRYALLAFPLLSSAIFLSSEAALAQTAVAPLGKETAVGTEPSGSDRPSGTPSTVSMDSLRVYANEVTPQNQVTSVSQLSDVRPTDWAFQALQSLVERYGCIVGYPDRTYRGNQALSRYEFAAGLNACLDRINELIAASTADLVKKEDLDALRKLQEEFAAELATLRGRVDSLEARTAVLERQQFSTTAKLRADVLFTLSDTFGDRTRVAGRDVDDETETTFAGRVRLNVDASFNGRDTLRTRLQAANLPNYTGTTGTAMTRLAADTNTNFEVEVDKLYYRFALGNRLRVQIDAVNADLYDGLFSTLSPFTSSNSGAISRFGRFNPLYRSGDASTPGNAGATLAYSFSDALRLELGFVSDRNSNAPTEKNGLFNGGVTGAAQIVFEPSKAFAFSLMYAYSYFPGADVNITSSTGSAFAIRPFGQVATRVHAGAAQLQFRLSPQIILGGWFGAQFASDVQADRDATVINAAAYLALPDLGGRSNLGGLLVGLPPKVTDNDISTREDPDTTIHVEAFYRYQINKFISVTPGVIVLFNPEHNNDNSTQYVGVIRTHFAF